MSKRRIFFSVFGLFTVLYYSQIAEASKYYYESYEPSAVYATASGTSTEDMKKISKATKTTKTTVSGDNVVKNTIFLKMKKKKETQVASEQPKDHTNGSETSVKNDAEKKKNDIIANKIIEQEQKEAKSLFINKRLGVYMALGFNLSAFPTIEYDNVAMDFGNNDAYEAPDSKPFKLLYGFDVSLGAKFYPLKSRTGPFVGAEFFYKYMNGKSSYNWQSQLSYQYQASNGTASTLHDDYSPDGAGKTSQDGYSDFIIYKQNAYLPATMVSQMEHLLGLGLRFGYSINRFSVYGRFNIGGIQMRHDLSMSDDAIKHVKSMSAGNEGPDVDSEYYNQWYAYKAIRANASGEHHKDFVTTFGPGVGIEVAINENIFLRVEYNHFFVSQTLKFDKITRREAIQYTDSPEELQNDSGFREVSTTAYKTTNGAEQMKIKMDFGTITASIGIVF